MRINDDNILKNNLNLKNFINKVFINKESNNIDNNLKYYNDLYYSEKKFGSNLNTFFIDYYKNVLVYKNIYYNAYNELYIKSIAENYYYPDSNDTKDL
jgi:predicted Fe-Mo cluster-binding NifX family protein